MLTVNEITLSFFLALSAWVFVNVLQSEGMIFEFYAKLIEKLPGWLKYPLGACDLCMAGQFGLWGYFFTGQYNVFEHLFFTVLTIFFIKLIDRIIYGLR
jgi:hypothetical protein